MQLKRNPLNAALMLFASLAIGCGTGASYYPAPTAIRTTTPVVAQVRPSTAIKWQVISGRVTQLLPDDNKGLPHQHFLVQLASNNKIIKVAHNTQLAPKVPVKVGDVVEMKCEYIQSKPYDVAHWTHYDPSGGPGGYIRLNGRTYDRL